ncbi:MAG: DUF2017 domain-containing protein [Actinomycetota bacterium]|nr:DUF2017 domain-containing protein [Actinomycetota bacterium]
MGKPRWFSQGRGGSIRMRFDDQESALLAGLAAQVIDFVAPEPHDPAQDPLFAIVGIDPSATLPDDPALARLFPDAFTDDDDAAAEFRRFTERDLRAGKAAHASTVIASLESRSDRLDAEQVAAWLGFLNDVRLTLGTRLGISEDTQAELAALAPDDERLGAYALYDWLTYLQDSLVTLLLPR